MGVLRWLAVVSLFVVSTALSHLVVPSFWVGLLAKVTLGAAVATMVLASLYSLRRPLSRLGQSYLDSVVGSAVVRSMPPGDVLTILLRRIYPDWTDFRELVAWILGGAGRDASGRDIVVSHDTRVHYRVEPVDDVQCFSHLTCRYRYTDVQDNHLLVIFATSNPRIARLIATERVYPLYELWILDEGDLDDFVPSQRATVQVGMRYQHDENCAHVVEPASLIGKEVDYRSYDRYLRIPANVDRNDIRMFVLDLHDLVDDHLVETIDEVTLASRNVANTDRGYLVWWPPHPCYVDRVSFDLEHLLSVNTDRELMYQVILSSIGSAGMQVRDWTPLRDIISVPVDAWMLPGHNVTLVYRPRYEIGTPHGNDSGRDR